MARLALELSIPAVPAWLAGSGASGGAGGMLGNELNGLAFDALTDTMEIRDTVTPANVYRGPPAPKFGSVRASAGLQYGPTGFLEWGPENLFPEVSGWSVNGATITPNATVAPDGTNTGILITATASPNAGILLATIGTSDGAWYTSSAYVKYDTANFVRFSITGLDGDHVTWFDMFLGAVASNPGGNVARIEDAGNGWRRISISRTLVSGPAFPLLILTDADGSDAVTLGKTAYAWGVQFEHGDLRPYLKTTTGAVYGLRRDFDPRIGGPKYLVEESRTNYMLGSRNLADVAYWNASGTIVANQAVSVMGDTTLAKWTTVGMSDDRIYQANGAASNAAGAIWVVSFWAKCETGTFTLPVIMDSVGGALYLSTSVVLTTTLQRFAVVGTADAAAGAGIRLLFGGFNSLNGTPSAVLYIGDVQVERDVNTAYLSHPATSYIPTTTATVTRGSDYPVIPIAQFPYSAAASTLYAKYGTPDVRTVAPIELVDTVGGGAGSLITPLANYRVEIYAAGGNTYTPSLTAHIPMAYNKVAVGVSAASENAALNGLLQGVSDTVPTALPTGIAYLKLGHWYYEFYFLNGWVAEGMYLPRRMSNSQLQVQTGGLPILSAADTLLGSATNGVAIAASDDSMTIKDTTNPLHNYSGSAVERFGTSVRASAGSYYNSTGVLAMLATGALRRDYSPFAAGSKFLVETQRTNVAPWSSAPDGHWSIYVGTGTWGAIAVPDGTTVNALLTITAGPVSIYNGGSFPSSGVPWTASVYAKAGTVTSFQLGINFNFAGAIFDLTTGIVTPANGHTGRMYSVGNGWWRCEAYITPTNPTNSIVIQTIGGAGTIALWGWQAEAGLTASSYIPTTTASVTRAADFPQLPTSQFPFSSTAGTMYAKYIQGSNDNTYPMSINITGNYSEYINLMAGGGYPPYGGYNFSIWTSEGLQTNQERPGYPPGPPYKSAGAWALNSANSAFQGLIWGAGDADDTTVTLNSAYNTLSIGHASYGAGNLNGWMLEALYLPTRIPNAELVTRTTP